MSSTILVQENYEVVEGLESIDLVLNENGVKSFFAESEQIEYNSAFVFKLKNEKVLVVSNEGLIGVLFYNQAAFKKALDEKKFPVDDPPSIFAKERESIVHIGENLNTYLERIGLTSSDVYRKDVLTDVSGRINQNQINKNDDRVLIAIGILLGEALRLDLKGEWRLDTEYSLNPYFIPCVYANKKFVDYWRKFFDHMGKSKVSLDELRAQILKYHN